MRKVFLVFAAALSVFGLGACVSKGKAIDAAHNSRNSVNWAGVYRGVTPGANSDIKVEITLGEDETYTISYQYIDKSPEVYTGSGTFKWDDAGSTITLDTDGFSPHYQVGENKLFQLDMAGKRITGALADMYILTKVP